MNNYKHILLTIAATGLLCSCFEDKGNYEYAPMQPPTWLIDVEGNYISVIGRENSTVKLDASKAFNWGNTDSLKRSQEVRYEWSLLDGTVISTELTETMPTEELMRRAGFNELPRQSITGLFTIIEKSTGVSFKARTFITLRSAITENDFIVYSAKRSNPGAGVLSTLSLDYEQRPGGEVEMFKLNEGVNEEIPGTPKTLAIAQALNVSASGSVTAITQEGAATVFNAGNLKKEWELSSQFDAGIPENFLVSARRDQELATDQPSFTWVATQDGRIFTRQMGKNYLGGKFISEPYYLDEKGYKITKFGHTLWGVTNIPCYDEKNHRVVLATNLPHHTTNTYRSFLNVLTNPYRTGGVPISNMPPDTEVFFMTSVRGGNGRWADNRNSWYEIYYKNGGESKMGTFSIDNYNRILLDNDAADSRMATISGTQFDNETVFLGMSATRFGGNSIKPLYTLFSSGNKIFAIIKNSNRSYPGIEQKELSFSGIESKITCMIYDRSHHLDYKHLIIGCENGDILVYNVQRFPESTLIKKFNVGARVASIKQLGSIRGTLDMY